MCPSFLLYISRLEIFMLKKLLRFGFMLQFASKAVTFLVSCYILRRNPPSSFIRLRFCQATEPSPLVFFYIQTARNGRSTVRAHGFNDRNWIEDNRFALTVSAQLQLATQYGKPSRNLAKFSLKFFAFVL